MGGIIVDKKSKQCQNDTCLVPHIEDKTRAVTEIANYPKYCFYPKQCVLVFNAIFTSSDGKTKKSFNNVFIGKESQCRLLIYAF